MSTNNRYRNRITRTHIVISAIFLLSISFLVCCSKPKVYRVGILSGLNFVAEITDGFKARLTELGYIEGKKIIYDVQQTDFDIAVYDRILKKFVKDKVDLIFVFPTEAAMQAKAVTRDTGIPVVFANAYTEDTGLIDSVQEPGGNITGVRWPGPEIVVKSFKVMQDLFPHIKRIVIPYQKNYPIVKSQLEALIPVVSSAGITLVPVPAANAGELETEIQKLQGPLSTDVFQFLAEPLMATPDCAAIIIKFAAEHKIPIGGTVIFTGDYQSVFGFMPDIAHQGRLAANMADKIFKGTPAGKIFVDTAPYLFQLNYRQIQKLGLTVKEELLSQADLIVR